MKALLAMMSLVAAFPTVSRGQLIANSEVTKNPAAIRQDLFEALGHFGNTVGGSSYDWLVVGSLPMIFIENTEQLCPDCTYTSSSGKHVGLNNSPEVDKRYEYFSYYFERLNSENIGDLSGNWNLIYFDDLDVATKDIFRGLHILNLSDSKNDFQLVPTQLSIIVNSKRLSSVQLSQNGGPIKTRSAQIKASLLLFMTDPFCSETPCVERDLSFNAAYYDRSSKRYASWTGFKYKDVDGKTPFQCAVSKKNTLKYQYIYCDSLRTSESSGGIASFIFINDSYVNPVPKYKVTSKIIFNPEQLTGDQK